MKPAMDITLLQALYRGFFMEQPVGNNAFSYELRQNKRIYVLGLVPGTLSDLSIGTQIAFSEVDEGREINKRGLAPFIYWRRGGQDIFIFDNHNHAFFFWLAALRCGTIQPGGLLRHVDQHTDMRQPPAAPPFSIDKMDLNAAFAYTNQVLNVGNFIRPALKLGIFSGVEIVDSSFAFEAPAADLPVLDLDMDIFSDEMCYIDEEYKLAKIRQYLRCARFITIATSPYFMDQSAAIHWIGRIFEHL